MFVYPPQTEISDDNQPLVWGIHECHTCFGLVASCFSYVDDHRSYTIVAFELRVDVYELYTNDTGVVHTVPQPVVDRYPSLIVSMVRYVLVSMYIDNNFEFDCTIFGLVGRDRVVYIVFVPYRVIVVSYNYEHPYTCK